MYKHYHCRMVAQSDCIRAIVRLVDCATVAAGVPNNNTYLLSAQTLVWFRFYTHFMNWFDFLIVVVSIWGVYTQAQGHEPVPLKVPL